jgi:hypothetical protein
MPFGGEGGRRGGGEGEGHPCAFSRNRKSSKLRSGFVICEKLGSWGRTRRLAKLVQVISLCLRVKPSY